MNTGQVTGTTRDARSNEWPCKRISGSGRTEASGDKDGQERGSGSPSAITLLTGQSRVYGVRRGRIERLTQRAPGHPHYCVPAPAAPGMAQASLLPLPVTSV